MNIYELNDYNIREYIKYYNFEDTVRISVEFYDEYNGYIYFESSNNDIISISGEIIVTDNFILLIGSSNFNDESTGIFIMKLEDGYKIMMINSEKLFSLLTELENARIRELDMNTVFYNDKKVISSCYICYDENVIGISPECCSCKQKICIKCLFLNLKNKYNEKYIYVIDFRVLNNLKILLLNDYPCPFCRVHKNYYKYLNLLYENMQ